jgi:hypothetical protein
MACLFMGRGGERLFVPEREGQRGEGWAQYHTQWGTLRPVTANRTGISSNFYVCQLGCIVPNVSPPCRGGGTYVTL